MKENILDIYSDYLISQQGQASATGLAMLLEEEISHDQVTRFLNSSVFGSRELWNFNKAMVRKHEREEGVLLLDDTIVEKPYTDESEINCWHFSHAKGRHVKGINLLSCLIRYGDMALPICYEVIHKKLLYSDIETRKVHRRSEISKNELFRQLIKQAVKCQVSFRYIMADNWFGAKDNMDYIHLDLNKLFIFGIKANRTVAVSFQDKQKGNFQKVSNLVLEAGKSITMYLKGIGYPLQLFKKVFTNEDGSIGTLYLVTNDLQLKDSQIYDIYQKRWKIEEFHKSIKQNSSITKSPTKTTTSQKNHIFASLCAFCKLEMLKFKTALNHFAIKYKLLVKANQAALKELQKFNNLLVDA